MLFCNNLSSKTCYDLVIMKLHAIKSIILGVALVLLGINGASHVLAQSSETIPQDQDTSNGCQLNDDNYQILATASPLVFNVLNNDGQNVEFSSYTIVNESSVGDLTSNGKGAFEFNPDEAGIFKFTYRASCNGVAINTDVDVTITVVDPQDSKNICEVSYDNNGKNSINEGQSLDFSWQVQNTFSKQQVITFSSTGDTRSAFNFTSNKTNGVIRSTAPQVTSDRSITYRASINCISAGSDTSNTDSDSITVTVRNVDGTSGGGGGSSSGGGSSANPLGITAGASLNFISKLQIFIRIGFGYNDLQITGVLDMPTINAIRAIRASRGL